MEDKNLKGTIGFLGFISLIALCFFIATYPFDNSKIETSVWGQYGDFIGGVIGTILTGIAGYFAYRAFKTQQKQLDDQNLQFQRQQIESRFFELLKIHRENVDQMKYGKHLGKNVFTSIKKTFNYFYTSTAEILYPNGFNNKTKDAESCIRIAWLITYYGLQNLYSALDDQITKILNHIEVCDEKKTRLKLFIWNNNNEFVGFQLNLSNYFRHLFQTVKYINNQPDNLINYNKKYEYIKTLRAQFDNNEQAVILYNSISVLGYAWEEYYYKKYNSNPADFPHNPEFQNNSNNIVIEGKNITKDIQIRVNLNYLTKYNLVKNIPNGFLSNPNFEIYDFNTQDFLPYMDFEFYTGRNDRNTNRTKLVMQYNSFDYTILTDNQKDIYNRHR